MDGAFRIFAKQMDGLAGKVADIVGKYRHLVEKWEKMAGGECFLRLSQVSRVEVSSRHFGS